MADTKGVTITASPQASALKGASPTWWETVKAFTELPVFLMLLLGFSAGLPFLLSGGTLAYWLRESGITLSSIALLSYVTFAYTLKFLWAPVLDHVRVPVLGRLLGRRRAWMLVAQVGVALSLLAMATTSPANNLTAIAFFALLVAFASATQDIAIDAWRIEVAPESRQGIMASAYQVGYRFALIAAGAGALYVAEYASWNVAYVAMAALMVIGMAAALLSPRIGESQQQGAGERTVGEAVKGLGTMGDAIAALYRGVVAPFVDFLARHKWDALLILALIASYRISDFVIGPMANTLYIDLGFSKVDIANIAKIYGVWLGLAGALAGGLLVARFGLKTTLVWGAIVGSISNLLFAWLVTQGNSLLALTITISLENVAGGVAGTILIAYMSSLTSTAFTATQYALFSSFYAIPGKILSGLSGFAVEGQGLGLGYYWFFIATAVIGSPAIILSLIVARRQPREKPKEQSA